jgi:hypothetical protein
MMLEVRLYSTEEAMLGILSGAMMIATRLEPVVTEPPRRPGRWRRLRRALLAAWG